MIRKMIVWMMLGAAVFSCDAADFRTVTGAVSQVRSGTKSVFYTLKSDDGRTFFANSAWDDVAANADRLQRAYETGERVVVEFQSQQKFPDDSIWKIRRMESATGNLNRDEVELGTADAGQRSGKLETRPPKAVAPRMRGSDAANSEPDRHRQRLTQSGGNDQREWQTLTSDRRPLISASPLLRSSRPNVLLIVSDDQGAGDFGFMGNQTVKTPNLDRLASESALFRQFVVCPACSPSRASLMTGRNHMKTGVWGVGERNNLMRDETLMPKFFKEAGYHTGYFGKRDGTYSVELEAWDRGCDEVTHVTGYQHKDPKTYTPTGAVQRIGWTCDLDTAAALDFIGRQGDEPWWCAVPYLLPHLPWVADEKFVQPYLDAGCSQKLADVYGCVSQLDAAVGDLLAGIERMGHAENTIVVFLSDNGPSYKGMSEADMTSRNPLGLQGQKALAWENGIRVPFMAKWPGKIPPGERTQFATVEDVLPTLLDLAGLPEAGRPAHLPFDGISICDALTDPAAPSVNRAVFRVAISYEGQAGGGAWAVNDPQAVSITEQHVVLHGPRFKFHNFAGGETALFDMQADPGESADVSGQFPEVAAQYAAELDRQYAEIQATGRTYQMPVVKIGPPEFRYNKISGLHVRRYEGGLNKVLPVDVGGFTAAGDRAEYAVLVEGPGEFMIEVNGKNLDAGEGWQLEADGKLFKPVESGSDVLRFGPVAFPQKGDDSFAVSVTGDGAAGQQAVISTLAFTPLK